MTSLIPGVCRVGRDKTEKREVNEEAITLAAVRDDEQLTSVALVGMETSGGFTRYLRGRLTFL